MSVAFEFQFHKGTIKTTAVDKVHGQFVKFQFHKGTIKTDKLYRLQQQSGKFQFHKGTIKTRDTAARFPLT